MQAISASVQRVQRLRTCLLTLSALMVILLSFVQVRAMAQDPLKKYGFSPREIESLLKSIQIRGEIGRILHSAQTAEERWSQQLRNWRMLELVLKPVEGQSLREAGRSLIRSSAKSTESFFEQFLREREEQEREREWWESASSLNMLRLARWSQILHDLESRSVLTGKVNYLGGLIPVMKRHIHSDDLRYYRVEVIRGPIELRSIPRLGTPFYWNEDYVSKSLLRWRICGSEPEGEVIQSGP